MDAKASRPGIVDPRRSEYDAKRSLISLFITFAVAAVVFGAFYLFSPRGPEVPTGPAIEEPINQTAPPTPETRHEETVQVPITP